MGAFAGEKISPAGLQMWLFLKFGNKTTTVPVIYGRGRDFALSKRKFSHPAHKTRGAGAVLIFSKHPEEFSAFFVRGRRQEKKNKFFTGQN